MNKPSFIIIGSYRSGTTSLYNYICQHPQIAKAKVKELNYFSKHWNKGKKWYYSQFPDVLITGEASPSYMPCSDSAYRMYADLTRVKIIAILRNPIDRAFSHCKKFNVGIERSLKYGWYAKQLKPYFDFFDVLTIQSEQYFNDEQKALNMVYSFLGVSEYEINPVKIIKSDYSNSPHREWLSLYYKQYNNDLWDLIGEKWDW